MRGEREGGFWGISIGFLVLCLGWCLVSRADFVLADLRLTYHFICLYVVASSTEEGATGCNCCVVDWPLCLFDLTINI